MILMKNALVILAGGKGTRFGGNLPKQFQNYNNINIIEHFISNIDISNFEIIVIVCKKIYFKNNLKNLKLKNNTKIVNSQPGKNRQQSALNALKKIKKNITNVLIHDAARPLCSNKLIKKIINNLEKYEAVIPFVNYSDRKIINNNKDINDNIKFIQTPQGFHFDLIYKLHLRKKNLNLKDDLSLIEIKKTKIQFIKGEKTNIKITYPEDIIFFNKFRTKIYKMGIGYDIHQIDSNTQKGLILCGIKIPYSKLIGHSDADVALHAICDSIFGALSMKDLGYYFSNKNLKWKNCNSSIFINFCKNKLIENGFSIVNLDINFICEKPNISKYRIKMISNLSKLLCIPKNIISIKATTNEKIGFIGDGKGIAAESIVQISNEKHY